MYQIHSRPHAAARSFPIPALAALLLLSGAVRGQEATAVLSGPTEPVTAGSRIAVWVHLLNASPSAVTKALPARLDARVLSEGVAIPVVLEASAPGEAGDVAIPANGFARKEYGLQLPAFVRGAVVLEVPGLDGSRVVLEVRDAQGAAPVPAEETPDSSTAPEEESEKWYDPVDFFKKHFFSYEPIYFIAGFGEPTTKFQISLRYQILNRDGYLAQKVPPLAGLNFAYTQVSLWDLGSVSSPFLDTSYKPEFLYLWERVDRGRWAEWFRLDLQGGMQHESNGNPEISSSLLGEGERTSYYVLYDSNGELVKTSRSLNLVYFRPTAVFGKAKGLQLSLSPRIWTYVGDLSDNPDIADYRGYADLRATLGWATGLLLSATGRMGHEWEHGSLQLDLSYPLMRVLGGSFSVYLYAQYFTGYGESLLLYDLKSETVRFGIALAR